MNLWCIHGNLQLPSVWNCFDEVFFESSLSSAQIPMTIQKEDLWNVQDYSIQGWTRSFLEKTAASRLEDKPWIMGYSLGGRLAMHAVAAKPEMWRGAIIVAADPGSSDAVERARQFERDNKWAERFGNEPWQSVIDEWDRLPVFGGFQPAFERNASDYPPERIGRMFIGFSKAKQRNMWKMLQGLQIPPTLYVSGEFDEKYRAIGERLGSMHKSIKHVSIPGACHRVPWENTNAFIKAIQYFIDSVTK